MANFEIRVGENEDMGKNEICRKQWNSMDTVQAIITCSRKLYGDWVSINKTNRDGATKFLVFTEVRILGRNGSKYSKAVWQICT